MKFTLHGVRDPISRSLVTMVQSLSFVMIMTKKTIIMTSPFPECPMKIVCHAMLRVITKP